MIPTYIPTAMDFSSVVSSSSSSSSLSTTKKRRSGRKKFQETRHPIYRGVRQRKGKWVCELREPRSKNSRLWLGTFSSPDMAARAYDLAAMALRGEHAQLNFPDEKAPAPEGEKAGVGDVVGKSSESGCVYVDEEELFNMPGLIDGLAEGLVVTPPALKKGFSWDSFDGGDDHGFDVNDSCDHEFSLWTD